MSEHLFGHFAFKKCKNEKHGIVGEYPLNSLLQTSTVETLLKR